MPPRLAPSDPGTYVPSYVDCARLYNDEGAGFALFVTKNNMPTGRVIPKPIIELMREAHSLLPAYVPFGSPDGTWEAAEAARTARRAELMDAARGLLALHDMREAA